MRHWTGETFLHGKIQEEVNGGGDDDDDDGNDEEDEEVGPATGLRN